MKVIELLNKVHNGEFPEDVEFYIYGELIEGIKDLEYKTITKDLLDVDVKVVDNKIEKADLPNYFEINGDKHKDVEHIYNQCIKIHDNTVYLEKKLNEIIDKMNKEVK